MTNATGLKGSTLKRYARSELLKRDDQGRPVYMHSAACPNFCDYACRGQRGSRIADDVEVYESSDSSK